jgi:ATP-binding cassette, subfamily B, multidrug efflux pump
MSASGQAFNLRMFFRLYKKSRPYKKAFSVTVCLVIVLSGMVTIRPELTKVLIDEALPLQNSLWIAHIALVYVAVLVLEVLLHYIQTQFANRMAQRITLDMRAELYQHVLRFRLRHFDQTPVGQFVTRLIGDIDGIAEIFSVGLLDIIRDLLKIVVIVVAMIWLDWKMALIVLLPVPLLLCGTRLFQQAVKNSFNDVRNEVARISVFIQEHVTGMAIVQYFRRENTERAKFDQINQEHRNAHIRGIWAYSIFFPFVELLSAASVALMLWWGVRGAFGYDMRPGVLLAFSTYIMMIYRPIRQMADNFNVLQMGMVNAERVFKVLDTNEMQDPGGGLMAQNIEGALRFEHVYFKYDEQSTKWILDDLNFEIHAGETLAIVGATGAGKSSIAGLLNRFYDYQKGNIFLDNQNLHSYDINALRAQVSLVLQEVFLFSDTIYNNITLYDTTITQEDVERAAKAIGAHAFIMRLPDGYDFHVRERGGMLSVGQRQLISFVRAYVHQPKLLILDEATAHIDSETEQLLQYATEQLTKGRTSIIIAHRLATIRRANRIIVIDQGQLVESGDHENLLQKNGFYARLYRKQINEETRPLARG